MAIFHFLFKKKHRVKYSLTNCISAKLLKVKGSGAEARAEGPFLRWQNRSGEATKSTERERGDPSPTPSGKAGGANARQL